VHAGGKVARPPELKRNLLYVIIAEATNMGLGAMAESCGVPYDVLAWTAEWYFRDETPEAANAAIVNYHLPAPDDPGVRHRHPVFIGRAAVPGQGQVADRPAPVPLLRPRPGPLHLHPRLGSAPDVRHQGDRGDRPGKPYVLDGILGNQTDLLIAEHATDTHGATTMANFTLFDLVGLQLPPPASATWARSPCTGQGRGPASRPATPSPGTYSPTGSTRS
jgi:hypothetical protein